MERTGLASADALFNVFFASRWLDRTADGGRLHLALASGLLHVDFRALCDEHYRFFKDADRDRLHPNDYGHRRIAETMRAAVLALPPEFKIREGVGD